MAVQIHVMAGRKGRKRNPSRSPALALLRVGKMSAPIYCLATVGTTDVGEIGSAPRPEGTGFSKHACLFQNGPPGRLRGPRARAFLSANALRKATSVLWR